MKTKSLFAWLAALALACGLQAQTGTPLPLTPAHTPRGAKSAAVPASQVHRWLGSGSNQAVVMINWAVEDNSGDFTNIALVWGVRWNGATNMAALIDTLDTYEEGLSFTWGNSHSFITSITYTGPVHVSESEMGWMYNVNGVMAQPANSQTIANGDFVEWSDAMASFNADSVVVLEALPTEATIDPADVAYWVGTGSHHALFAVSWADTALAWGYRFETESVTVQALMDDLQSADPRLSYTAGWGVEDILFATGDDTLRRQGAYWMYNVNGITASLGYDQQLVRNGDFVKFGDIATAIAVDSTLVSDPTYGDYMNYAYVWPTEVHPVSSPRPADEAIDPADILYWVGTGSHRALFAVSWADTALAWGYRFETESVTVQALMDDLQSADPRLSYTAGWGVDDILFVAGDDTLRRQGAYWLCNVNGVGATLGYDQQQVRDGDFVKYGDVASAVVVDSTLVSDPTYGDYMNYDYVWLTEVHPVSEPEAVPPTEATLTADAIRFWVGSGEQQAIVAVNWAEPNICLAWGYRFSGTSTLQTAMDTLAAADPRFAYVMNGYMLDDILFVEDGDTLKGVPGTYWANNLNGAGSQGLQQELHDGDFTKWGDMACATVTDSAEYDGVWYPMAQVWTTPVTPVDDPYATSGPFCGAVGTEGCDAIPANSEHIVAWATACVVERGLQNIALPDGPRVSYGNDTMAIGPASMTNNLNVVSLGDAGTALLTFAAPIADGEGPDFAVYENSFSDGFLELAFVEVSSDGERFVRFPATSLTQTHTQIHDGGNVDPTFINNLAGKYRNGWGTPFDLAELRDSAGLDISAITHIRLVDVVGSIDPQWGTRDAAGRLINDPYPTNSYSGGFDLAGIAVLHQTNAIGSATAASLRLYPNPANGHVQVETDDAQAVDRIEVYDMTGRVALTAPCTGRLTTLPTHTLQAGIYVVKAGTATHKLVVRH
ncbi:MAG: DUF4430 domain-containing protein [Bacteroidales bacterium]|nr:DUF4430 domain-containing protein [Bacteroidales bacterium]